MSGATALVNEVDGTPCTIRYHADGSMTGTLGFSNEERDVGRWRIDGDRWYRQWSRWNYGEEKGYFIVIDGGQIKYFNDEGQLVDSGFFQPGNIAEASAGDDLPGWPTKEVATGPM
jgi:GntR family transcriptional regulator/MocR family aminotransferase